MGGRETRDLDAVELARVSEVLGAGEIMLNCIDMDGQGAGYDLPLVAAVQVRRARTQSSVATAPLISRPFACATHTRPGGGECAGDRVEWRRQGATLRRYVFRSFHTCNHPQPHRHPLTTFRLFHSAECFEATDVSAALAAGMFHRQEVLISEVKAHMAAQGIPTRVV